MSDKAITLPVPDYQSAFALSFSVVWGSTIFANEVSNLAYFRALTCFYGSTQDDLSYRRKLMYAYLRNDFGSDSQDDTINQLYNVIPVQSSLKRVLRNLCGLYSQAPNRKFGVVNPAIAEAYKKSNINSSFKYAHKLGRLCNTVLVMPTVRDFKIEIDVLPPDLFRVDTDPKDFKKITALWIPISTIDKAGSPVYTFKVWTKETYQTLDLEGREITSEVNPYGVIPGCILQFENDSTDFYGGGNYDLLDAIIDDNKSKFLANNDLVYTSFSVWIATNLGTEITKIAPNRVMKVNKVSNDVSQDSPPSLENVSGNGVFPNIELTRTDRNKEALRNQGIPESLVSANPGLAPSGAALKADRQELMEIRVEDTDVFSRFENEFYPVFAKVVNHGLSLGLPGQCSVSVDYIEPQEYIDPKDALADKQAQFDAGIIGAKDYLNYFVTNENITTDEQAIEFMSKNLSLRERLKNNGQSISNNTESQTEGSSGSQSSGTGATDTGTGGATT